MRCSQSKSASILRIHTASFAASDSAINSASVVESETHVCFLQAQLIAPPFNKKIYPEFDFLSMRHSAQFASA